MERALNLKDGDWLEELDVLNGERRDELERK